jgi:hypothetical protein
MVARHSSTDGVNALYDVIEKSGATMTRLLHALDPDTERTRAKLEKVIRRALPPAHHGDLRAYADAESNDGEIRMQAGYLIGLAVAQRIFAPVLKAIDDVSPQHQHKPRRGGRR